MIPKQSVPIVQPAGDESLGDGLSGVDWEPPKDLPEHAEGVETIGRDGVDLLLHGQLAVQDDAEVAGLFGGFGEGTEFTRPPRVIPWGGAVLEDQSFYLVCVEFETVVLHPVDDARHESVDVGPGGGRVF